ncbi:MAG: hypothetical protein KME25_33115 [Symplocastrum torsivum CPER-KK1]|jgi:hypothetical protein|uniref:Uncharacterized protein n=1 Tax=Symplocastrum torsivum CPER-KK1 TaxID=450513 RepID=A0A951UDE3_9CYAN|nr:hypothetical protein [Symplocastrum torsivum CPER-KK1]
MHSINSFSDLLTQGQITEALQLRLEVIEASARHYRQDLEAAKVSSAALGVVGLLLSANPLVAVIAGCGLAGYGWTVLRDYQNTKRLCLLPLVRKGTGELLTGIGLAATNDQGEADDPLLGVIGYVEPELAHEYELVMVAEAQLTGYLAQLPGESRLNAFRHILRHTRLRNSLKLPPLQDVALAIASGTVPSSSQSLPPQTEPVPEEVPAIDVAAMPVDEKLSAPQPVEAPAVVVEPPLPIKKEPITVVLFDFSRLRTEPDQFAHLRVIGGTGIGKTTFVDWLLDILGGSRFVITPKKKSWNWVGLEVYGLWFDYETIRAKLQWIHAEMYRRYPLMEQGETFEITNFVVDEWRLINTNVKTIKERDPETKQNIEVAPSAKAMMKDIITVARESMLRLIALAQGENVASWGFEGESDLEECFTDIRLGEFAIDYAKSLRNQCRKDGEDYEYWTTVLTELEWQQSRRTSEGKSIPCCMVGKYPARIPDLTDWKRNVVDINSEEIEPTNLSTTDPSTNPSQKDTLSERKLPFEKVEASRKPDGISLEALSTRLVEALESASGEASIPLFEGLERDGKLIMLRLLLTKRLGREKMILLGWGVRSGGRSHDKYKLASELLDAMLGELSELGFNEGNNWRVDE